MNRSHRRSLARRIVWPAVAAVLFAAASGAWAAAAASPSASASGVPGHPAVSAKKAKPPVRPVIDINSASRKQLKTLPGIGDAEADRIIAGRPYLSKADLVSSKAIPAGTYLSIKRAIVAKQPAKPSSKG
ncbi:MAG TPA: helix-hairpin-helix domain-containing protein [Albitalea sp.]|nr:helix-hairpin-helix domain-containing protein [Albitalea sp.]